MVETDEEILKSCGIESVKVEPCDGPSTMTANQLQDLIATLENLPSEPERAQDGWYLRGQKELVNEYLRRQAEWVREYLRRGKK